MTIPPLSTRIPTALFVSTAAGYSSVSILAAAQEFACRGSLTHPYNSQRSFHRSCEGALTLRSTSAESLGAGRGALSIRACCGALVPTDNVGNRRIVCEGNPQVARQAVRKPADILTNLRVDQMASGPVDNGAHRPPSPLEVFLTTGGVKHCSAGKRQFAGESSVPGLPKALPAVIRIPNLVTACSGRSCGRGALGAIKTTPRSDGESDCGHSLPHITLLTRSETKQPNSRVCQPDRSSALGNALLRHQTQARRALDPQSPSQGARA